MSNLIIIGGSVLCGLYCSVRLGLFGKTVVKIYKDDGLETVMSGPLWNTYYYAPADYGRCVSHISFKPVQFEYMQTYRSLLISKISTKL